ncbi:hypothetical protein [Geotalea uraniireducens]|uniref:Lipoprotein n=1 Tax=Geotalea uraniireducens (strain Rf4) TaxID=351605 RepID=A5GDM7_GEOUR|nr:hypothetical protein [Geotalea uraniireducens]ABQ24313.1 hypothetical protein Gura_0097 [Geotalea uraniireducens Rf4]
MQKILWILAILAMTMSGCGAEWFPETVRSPTTPDDFFFTPAVLSGVTPKSTATSNAITIAGIQSGSAPISVSGDASSQYKISDGAFTKDAGTVNNTDKVTVQHTAASGVAQTITTTLTIGDKSASFSSKTANVDSFNFTKTGPANTSIVSEPITLTLVPGTYKITITNGTYSFDKISFVDTEQTRFFNNNQIIYIQNVTAKTSGGVVTTVVTIDGVVSFFKTTAE